MKKLLLCASLVAICLSCAKEPVQAPELGGDTQILEVTLGVGSESQSQSKVAVDTDIWKSTWETTDKVGAWLSGSNDGTFSELTIATYDADKSTFTGTVNSTEGDDSYRLFFPYDDASSVISGGKYTVDLSAQNGDVSDPYLISDVAIAEGEAMTPNMKHVGAFLTFKADLSSMPLKVASNNSETVNLTGVKVFDMLTVAKVDLALGVSEDGFLTTTTTGVLEVTFDEPISITSSSTEVVTNLQILPFELASDADFDVVYIYEYNSTTYYCYMGKANATGDALSFERATYNTVTLTVGNTTSYSTFSVADETDLKAVGKGDYFKDISGVRSYMGNWSLDADYILTEDITLLDSWTPISSFSGTFDGDNRTIKNLTINASAWKQGLFGSSSGTIQDVNLENCNVTGGDNTGALVGQNSGTVIGCSASGSVQQSGSSGPIGGIVGYNTGTVAQCSSTTSVSGYCWTGGIVGYQEGGYVVSCAHTAGEVTASSNEAAGGVVGYAELAATIVGCYNQAAVSANTYAGGIVGNIYSSNSVKVTACYNTGGVSATRYVGGISGVSHATFLSNYYLSGTASYGRGGYAAGTADNAYEVILASDDYMKSTVAGYLTTACATYNEGITDANKKACAFTQSTGEYPTIVFGSVASN